MKKDLGRRAQLLGGLMDSLDIVDPADFSDQGDTTNNIKSKRKNRELCWRSRSPVKPVGFGSESFELGILWCGDASRLLRFMGQLDGMLHDSDSYGDILRIAHTCGRDTIVTIQMQPTKFSNLMLKMAIMPGVERVAKGPLATGTLAIIPQKSGAQLLSGISLSKRVRVSLKETEVARQEPELVPVLA